MKKLVIDLDGTICTQEASGEYELARPMPRVIEQMKKYKEEGWHITIFTARGMNSFDGDVDKIEKHYRILTEEWLEFNKVPYDRLLFGKPAGDLYVDDKGCNVFLFTCSVLAAR